MEFTVEGKYHGIDAHLLWRDGVLTGKPDAVVEDLHYRHHASGVDVGGQHITFDLEDFEIAHLFLSGIFLDDAVTAGDRPPDDSDRIY